MKKAGTFLFMVFVMAIVAPCFADNIEGKIYSNKSYISNKSLALSPGIQINLYSTKSIDLSLLLTDIVDEDDFNTINAKINAKRIVLFPDDEIILTLARPEGKSEKIAQSGIVLVYAIYWWSNANGYGDYWYAVVDCHAADMFTDVEAGAYYLYVGYPWAYWTAVGVPYDTAYSQYGGYASRGFEGVGAYAYNQASIVMYFYNAY